MVGRKLLPITPSRWSIVLIRRIIAVLLGVVVIIAAGLGIAYALKKKHILLVATDKSEMVIEIRLKRDEDGGNIFNGTFKEDGELHKITLRKAYEEGGRPQWLLSSDDKLVAILATQPEMGGIFSFLLDYDPPDSDAQDWTIVEGSATSFSHSWY